MAIGFGTSLDNNLSDATLVVGGCGEGVCVIEIRNAHNPSCEFAILNIGLIEAEKLIVDLRSAIDWKPQVRRLSLVTAKEKVACGNYP